ncbi:MAG: hypothetical protein ACNI25_04600 [Halarcobacter sp.]
MEILEVYKIWDKAVHNAFTDLIWFNNSWYCTFREGDNHVCDEGKIRIICSKDTKEWKSVALIKFPNGDLRDPKLSITKDNKLVLNAAARLIQPINGNKHQSLTWISTDGIDFDKPFTCTTGLGTWRWRITIKDDLAYSIAYGGKDIQGCLYSSKDCKSWEIVKNKIYPDVESFGNESSLVFLENGDAYTLLRRDKASCTAMLGFSKPPYTTWEWSDLKVRIGGPKMITIPNEKCFLAGVRLNDKRLRTSLCWIDPEMSKITEVLTLPSGGDTSYTGLVYREGFLWVSYYSSHEGKTAIYFAKIKI